MADRDPWIKFYPKDYLSDLELATCSAAAQGVYMRLLCLMHNSNEYGFAIVSGAVPTPYALAKAVQMRYPTCTNAVAELLQKCVLKKDHRGVLYSQRMLSDKVKLDVMRERGKLGGNPALVNPKDKPEQMEIQNKNKKEKHMAADAPFVREFENDFWPLVRKKETKADSLRLFVSLRKKGAPLATLLSGLKEYQRAKADDDTKYLMQPKKFLGPGEHWKEWAEKAEVAEAETQRAKEANERREKTVLKRTVQPTNPNPNMAKQLRELAANLGDGMSGRVDGDVDGIGMEVER